jgi:isochorismate hydrolase
VLNAERLDTDRAMLLVIDVQEKLLPLIDGWQPMLEAMRLLVRGTGLFEVPVLASEQYPKGIGRTVGELATELGRVQSDVETKTAFSVCGDKALRVRIREMDRDQIIVCGIEAHVCVQQTTLDLLVQDYQVFVCADAIGSRRKLDYEMAVARMRQAGAAVTTVESVLFDLCVRCDAPKFKRMIELIKSRDAKPHAPEHADT